MNPHAISERIRQGKAVLLSMIFLVLIWVPTLDWIFHLDHAPMPNEKRLLAKFPECQGVGQLRVFVAGLEQYFNDHFGFRKRLVRANNHWKRQLFRDAPDNNVVTGRDGWLFFTGDRTLDNYFGEARFSQQDLEAWRKLLEKRQEWLKKRGGKYLFVISPDKHNIYPEYLPEWFVKSSKPGKPEQLVAYLKTHSTVEAFYPRESLLAAKPLGVSYLKTDTHWNFLGGFISCEAVVQTLRRQMPELKTMPLGAFDCKQVEAPAGDLSEIVDDSSTKETQAFQLMPRPPLKPLKVTIDDSRLPKKWLKRTDPTITGNDDGQGKAVVFHDSFACGWQPFLGYHFKEVVYIWQYNWDAAFLEREKPDVVIDEMLERFFNNKDPGELLKQDDLK